MVTIKTIEHKRKIFGQDLTSGFEHQLINAEGQPFWTAKSRELAEQMAKELNEMTSPDANREAAILNQ